MQTISKSWKINHVYEVIIVWGLGRRVISQTRQLNALLSAWFRRLRTLDSSAREHSILKFAKIIWSLRCWFQESEQENQLGERS